MGRERWELLLDYAMLMLKGLPKRYALGGGTVLRFLYNHRDSNDIDIFLQDRQLLNYVSPRVNDAVEAHLNDYVEAEIFTKLKFAEGEVDFILASPVTDIQPRMMRIAGHELPVESQIEIIAKKLHYRLDDIKPRDVFDTLTVFRFDREMIIENRGYFSKYIDRIEEKFSSVIENDFSDDIRMYTIFENGNIVLQEYRKLYAEFIDGIHAH